MLTPTVWIVVAALSLTAAGCKDDEPEPPPLETKIKGPEFTGEVTRPVTLTPHARVPEVDPSFESIVVSADKLVFNYKSKPTVKLEKDHVVAGAKGGGYLRRITAVTSRTDSRVEVTTKHAYITDLILDGAFKVVQKPSTKGYTPGNGIIGGRQSYLESKFPLIKTPTIKGFSCSGGYGTTKPDLGLIPSVDVAFDPEFELDIVRSGWLPPRGKLKSATIAIAGELDLGFTEQTSSSGPSFSCQLDLMGLVRKAAGNKNLGKVKLPPIEFAIALPVPPFVLPVIITNALDPIFQVEAGATQTIKGLTVKHSTSYGMRVGIAYTEKTGWQGIAEVKRSAKTSVTQPEEYGEMKVSAGISAGIQYSGYLYDLVGPKAGIAGALDGSYTIKVDECRWETAVDVGLNVVFGAEVKVPVLDVTLVDYSHTHNLVKVNLYKNGAPLEGCGDAGVEAGIDAGPDAGPDMAVDTGMTDQALDSFPDAPVDVSTPDTTPDAGPISTWAVKGGGSGTDWGESIALDSQGNTYIAGYYGTTTTATFGTTTLISQGDNDIVVAKLDGKGAYLWAARAGGPQSDRAYGVALDGSGNIYTAGDFAGKAAFDATDITAAGTSRDIFVAKLDSAGKFLWAAKAGGSGNDINFGLAATSTGTVYACGRYSAAASFGTHAVNASGGSTDGYIAELSTSGSFNWVTSFGGTSSESCHSLALDSAGNIYIAGTFNGTANFGTTAITTKGLNDAFVAKLDSTGKFLWAVPLGGANNDDGVGVALDGSGNCYVTGNFSGTIALGSSTLTSKSATDRDVFIAKLSPLGAVQWAVRGGSPYFSDSVGKITVDGAGNSYFTGYITGNATFGATAVNALNGTDVFVVKIDSTGKVVGSTTGGGTSQDFGRAIAVDSAGSCRVTGKYASTGTFDTTTLNASGNSDLFVWRTTP